MKDNTQENQKPAAPEQPTIDPTFLDGLRFGIVLVAFLYYDKHRPLQIAEKFNIKELDEDTLRKLAFAPDAIILTLVSWYYINKTASHPEDYVADN